MSSNKQLLVFMLFFNFKFYRTTLDTRNTSFGGGEPFDKAILFCYGCQTLLKDTVNSILNSESIEQWTIISLVCFPETLGEKLFVFQIDFGKPGEAFWEGGRGGVRFIYCSYLYFYIEVHSFMCADYYGFLSRIHLEMVVHYDLIYS